MQKKHGGGTKEKIAEIGRTNHGLTVDDGILTFDDDLFGHNDAIFGNGDAIFGHDDTKTGHEDTKSNDVLCNRKAGGRHLIDGLAIDLESNNDAKISLKINSQQVFTLLGK